VRTGQRGAWELGCLRTVVMWWLIVKALKGGDWRIGGT
jgi:hypothetical protein